MRRKLTVLGVNGGNGVMLYPFYKDNVNFDLVGNIEPRQAFHTKFNEQWYANFKCDIYKTLEEFESSMAGIMSSTFDLVIGHPDCGAGSKLRLSRAKTFVDYKDNPSVQLFIDVVNKYEPYIFVFETLPAFLKDFTEEDFKIAFPLYEIELIEGSVAVFGNSQVSRVRLLVVGKLKWKKFPLKKAFPTPKVKESLIKTAVEFEEPLEANFETGNVREPLDMMVAMKYKNQPLNFGQVQKLWEGEFAGKPRWHVGGKMNNLPGVNRNLPDKPPMTVRKQNRQFRSDGFVLSPREMANIQGIPKDFKIVIQPDRELYWINKGRVTVTKCPPYEIGEWVRKRILKIRAYTRTFA